jgi:hypothetical protein
VMGREPRVLEAGGWTGEVWRRGRGRPPEPEPGPGAWTLQIYERPDGACPYARFLAELDPYRRAVLDVAVRTFLGRQGHNVCDTEWGTALGKGLYEFRVRRTLATICREAGAEVPAGVSPDQKVLLRVFFAVEGAKIVLLLSGYDKGADPTAKRQDKEIKLARKLLTEHQQTRRRAT